MIDERKNYQVPLMKAMYSSAMLVRVWLGEGAEGNDEGITVFEKLFQGENPPFGNIRIDGKPLNVRHTFSVVDLLSRSWWQRTSVRQEFVLATAISIALAGIVAQLNPRSTIKVASRIWRPVASVALFVIRATYNQKVGEQILSLIYFLRLAIEYLRNTPATPENVESRLHGFLQTLATGSHYSYSNPRDFIYGFLVLVPDEFACVFQPDEDSAVVRVFHHFAVLFIHTAHEQLAALECGSFH